MLFTYIAGFLFNIVLCFCMGDPAEILGTTIGQPVAQLFYNSLGKGGGIFYTVCGFIILEFVCFTAMVCFKNPLASGKNGLTMNLAIISANSFCFLP